MMFNYDNWKLSSPYDEEDLNEEVECEEEELIDLKIKIKEEND